MSDGVSVLKSTAWLCGALLCAAFLLHPDCAARGRAQRGGLPRVGTIKDYPATGLMVGCGNYYFHPPSYRPETAESSLVFIANSDGSHAWMNLGGRDVRLTPVKTPARLKSSQFNYRHGSLRVTVVFEKFATGEQPPDEDFTIKIRIILRRGRAVRTARAIGYADC
jgi:hypothetical protein